MVVMVCLVKQENKDFLGKKVLRVIQVNTFLDQKLCQGPKEKKDSWVKMERAVLREIKVRHARSLLLWQQMSHKVAVSPIICSMPQRVIFVIHAQSNPLTVLSQKPILQSA